MSIEHGEAQAVVAAAKRVAERVLRDGVAVWGPYTLDLTLEGLAALGTALNEPRYTQPVLEVARQRGWTPAAQPPGGVPPFTLLMFEVMRLDGVCAYAEGFVAATRAYREHIARARDGAVLHPRAVQWGGGHAVLLDSMQEYCRRMAAAGMLGGEADFFEECATQVRIHRDILRDELTGLWHQGRGWWDDPQRVSDGAWSRGHGWLLRGLVESLRCMPRDNAAHGELRSVLHELACALVRVQDGHGMWHALLDRPADESAIESSGTGMIAYSLARAMADGVLLREEGGPAVKRAWAGLAACVTDDGSVLHACPGPGPLRREHSAQYCVTSFAPGEAHGAGAVLLAGAGAALLHPG